MAILDMYGLRGRGREGLVSTARNNVMRQPFHKNVRKKFPYTNPYHVLTSERVHMSIEYGMTL